MAKLIQYRTHASLYDGAFDATVGWAAAGMGYLIVTDGGRLIVIDGGFAEDVDDLLALMTKYTGEAVPTVALWIIKIGRAHV